jgi:hypothetical protein
MLLHERNKISHGPRRMRIALTREETKTAISLLVVVWSSKRIFTELQTRSFTSLWPTFKSPCALPHISRPDFSQRYYMLNHRREYVVLPYMTQPSTQLPSLASLIH